MFFSSTSTGALTISLHARKLFKSEKYQEVVDLLAHKQLDRYLHSLFQRSLQKIQEKNIVTDFSGAVMNQTITQDEHTTILPQKERTVSIVSKVQNTLLNKKHKQTLEESAEILGNVLKKQEILSSASEEEKQILINEVQQEELKLAQNVQAKLLPQVPKDVLLGIDTYVASINCTELSGDVYDFIASNDNETIFYIGDVTGHGTAAGLVMTMVSCLAHSIFSRTSSLFEGTVNLNKQIKPKLKSNMFATMMLCKWHQALKEFSFVGAGHERILHYRAESGEVEEIASGGLAIGMLPDITPIIKEQNIVLKNGDIILLFTDGIPECWDSEKKEMFGVERLKESLLRAREFTTANDVGGSILNDVESFRGTGEKTDDVSIIVLKRDITEFESKERNDFLQKQIEKDLLKDESAIVSHHGMVSPEQKKIQDDFIKKSKQLIQIALEIGDIDKAEQSLQKVIPLSPEDKDLILFEEQILHLKKQQAQEKYFFIKNIWRSLKRVLFSEPSLEERKYALVRQLFQEAKAHIKQSRWEQAEKIKEEIIQIDSKSEYIRKIDLLIVESKESERKRLSHTSYSLLHTSLEKTVSKKTDAPSDSSGEELQKSNRDLKYSRINLSALFSDFREDMTSAPNMSSVATLEIDRYHPLDIISDEDILGLKKLLSIKAKNQKNATELEGIDIKNPLSVESLSKIKDLKIKNTASDKLIWERSNVLEKNRKKYNKFMSIISPMNSKDLFSFVEKLSSFVKAKIPIASSLQIMQEQAVNDGYIYVLDELNKSLDQGKMLSQALERFPQHFPEVLRYLIHAGEKSGALPEVLSELADNMREQQIVQSKIRSAMIYPGVIITASIAMIVGMLWFIVPRLVKVYSDTGVPLPAITQFIVSLSTLIQNHFLIVVGVIIAIILGIYFFGKTKQGIRIYHKLYLHIPVVQIVARQNNIMLFANNLGILLENGVSIIEALHVISKIVPNIYFRQEIVKARQKMVDEGVPLSKSLGIDMPYVKRQKLFPMEVLQTISIGEQTGTLDEMMKSASFMYKEQIKNTVKNFSEILEPVMLICVGLMVAVILLSIMFPLFNLGKVIRKQ